jgi:hypothetical protein
MPLARIDPAGKALGLRRFFGKHSLNLERLAHELGARASDADDVEEAFSIALALESSELDVNYTSLLQSSPLARFPDLEETQRSEIGRQHEALLEIVRARSKDEENRMQAALLTAGQP